MGEGATLAEPGHGERIFSVARIRSFCLRRPVDAGSGKIKTILHRHFAIEFGHAIPQLGHAATGSRHPDQHPDMLDKLLQPVLATEPLMIILSVSWRGRILL